MNKQNELIREQIRGYQTGREVKRLAEVCKGVSVWRWMVTGLVITLVYTDAKLRWNAWNLPNLK